MNAVFSKHTESSVWHRFLSLTVLVRSLLLLKTMTDVFCNVDGMACCHGDPGLKKGTAVIHACLVGALGEESFVQQELHLTPQCHTDLQMLMTS